jgi:phosphohistidine phosphatase
MSIQLLLLRHGNAEAHGTRPDAERRLTPSGEREARNGGRAIVKLGIDVEVIFTSPKVRALDTARLANESIERELVVHQPLEGWVDGREALELLGDHSRVLLVGHEPNLSRLAGELCGVRMNLATGGLVAIRIEGGGAELMRLLRPRDLAEIASD